MNIGCIDETNTFCVLPTCLALSLLLCAVFISLVLSLLLCAVCPSYPVFTSLVLSPLYCLPLCSPSLCVVSLFGGWAFLVTSLLAVWPERFRGPVRGAAGRGEPTAMDHWTRPNQRANTSLTAENECQISRVSAHWVLYMLYGGI